MFLREMWVWCTVWFLLKAPALNWWLYFDGFLCRAYKHRRQVEINILLLALQYCLEAHAAFMIP